MHTPTPTPTAYTFPSAYALLSAVRTAATAVPKRHGHPDPAVCHVRILPTPGGAAEVSGYTPGATRADDYAVAVRIPQASATPEAPAYTAAPATLTAAGKGVTARKDGPASISEDGTLTLPNGAAVRLTPAHPELPALPVYPGALYPDGAHGIPTAVLHTLNTVAKSADPARPVLRRVHVSAERSEAAATDSYRLHTAPTDTAPAVSYGIPVTVPATFHKAKVPTVYTYPEAHGYHESYGYTSDGAEVRAVYGAPDPDQYPNYPGITPRQDQTDAYPARIPAGYAAAAAQLPTGDPALPVRFTADGAETDTATLPAPPEGYTPAPDGAVGYNPRYLADAVKDAPADAVIYAHPSKPGVLRLPDGQVRLLVQVRV